MIYAYDTPLLMPTMDLYDKLVMAMAISAAKDVYDKSQEQMKDFYTKYGDFMSPFAKDMEAYGDMMGNISKVLDYAYENGIDLFKSPEGRQIVSRLSNSVNPREYNAMRENAKIGYAYLDAMQKLISSGKYSQEQEDFDMQRLGLTPFDQFLTIGAGGRLNMWNRTSPIERATLQDLTKSAYEKRTARLLSREDFNDPRLQGKYAYDPRYEWYGYLDSDLMKVAPGASASLAGDPRAEFFRDLARRKVLARGEQATDEAVEAQFQRDIADANTWALMDPTRNVDQYALENVKFGHNLEIQRRANESAERIARIKANGDGNDSGSGNYQDMVFERAQDKRTAASDVMAMSYLKNNPKNLGKYKRLVKEAEAGVSGAQERLYQFMQDISGNVFVDWLKNTVSRVDDDGKKTYSIFEDLLNLGDITNKPHKLVSMINRYLDAFAVPSTSKDDALFIFGPMNFHAEDNSTDPWYTGGRGRILTPHHIMSNMIKFYGGKDGSSDMQSLASKVLGFAGTVGDWNPFNASASDIANRTDAIKSLGECIIAPDDNGQPRVYVKVKTKSSDWFTGERNGYWLETNLLSLPNGTMASDGSIQSFSSELEQRKAYGDAASTHAFENNAYK